MQNVLNRLLQPTSRRLKGAEYQQTNLPLHFRVNNNLPTLPHSSYLSSSLSILAIFPHHLFFIVHWPDLVLYYIFQMFQFSRVFSNQLSKQIATQTRKQIIALIKQSQANSHATRKQIGSLPQPTNLLYLLFQSYLNLSRLKGCIGIMIPASILLDSFHHLVCILLAPYSLLCGSDDSLFCIVLHF